MSKIFITMERLGTGSGAVIGSTPGGDVVGYAMAEDGHVLCSHLSSSRGYLRHDMGLTSDWKHKHYKDHYPDGYELVDLTDYTSYEELLKVPEFAAAAELNKALADEQDEPTNNPF